MQHKTMDEQIIQLQIALQSKISELKKNELYDKDFVTKLQKGEYPTEYPPHMAAQHPAKIRSQYGDYQRWYEKNKIIIELNQEIILWEKHLTLLTELPNFYNRHLNVQEDHSINSNHTKIKEFIDQTMQLLDGISLCQKIKDEAPSWSIGSAIITFAALGSATFAIDLTGPLIGSLVVAGIAAAVFLVSMTARYVTPHIIDSTIKKLNEGHTETLKWTKTDNGPDQDPSLTQTAGHHPSVFEKPEKNQPESGAKAKPAAPTPRADTKQ